VALAYLRARDEADADRSLLQCCEAMFEGRRPGLSVSSLRPWHRLPRMLPRVLRGHPFWVASRWSPEFAGLVRDVARSWRPEVVQAEFGAMGMYLPAARSSGARTVVTFHDPEPSTAHDLASRSTGAEWLMWRTEAALWRIYDRRLLGSVDAAVAFTHRDAAVLSALGPGAPIATVPLAVDIPVEPADPVGESPPSLLFVGSFNHPPNVEAARYLLDDVFPRLRARHAGITLALVGGHPPAWLQERAGDGIRVTGYVPDLRPLMKAATVFVAPLRQGGGMRLKVLEALAAGKATVGTRAAFEGTGVEAGTHALVADDAAGFCEAIERLLGDVACRVALGRAARAHIARALSWDRTALAYEALYDRILARGPRPPARAPHGSGVDATAPPRL
jgi:glycosyltransferase involved in cell wall biosynthesis